jgi:RsiW-degrading membrane proteinase PrsW (M82 family)
MRSFDVALVAICALSGAAWAALAAWRSPEGTPGAALRALAGGAAAFGIALGAYEALRRGGVDVSWEAVLSGGPRAVLLAAAIGLVEEGAKLAGIALAAVRPDRPGVVLRSTIGVAAGFAALEAMMALRGVAPPAAIARALLGPAAHAILAAPLGLAVAAAARGGRGRWLWLAPGLVPAAALHGVADLSLAAPRFGRIGYAVALLAPVVALFVYARRIVPAVR